MQLLYPYFQYDLFGKQLDILPVSDGQKTYWLVPLIVGFDTKNVPWSVSNPYLRLVGYALVDVYNGKVTLIKTGDDFFTNMFASQYGDQFIDMPHGFPNNSGIQKHSSTGKLTCSTFIM